MENQPFTIEHLQCKFKEELKSVYPTEEINTFLAMLAEEYLGWTRAQWHSRPKEVISQEILALFLVALNRLKGYEPIQYIIGHTPFLGLDIDLEPGVLIPRPETEELCTLIIQDNVSRRFESFSLVDIGAGSGCIGLSLKKNFPYCDVLLIDQSTVALEVARKNARKSNLEVTIEQFDLLDPTNWARCKNVNIMVSNPPYVLTSEVPEMEGNVLLHEPHEALFVPDSNPLLYYKAISSWAFGALQRPGLLYFEINEKFGAEIQSLLLKTGFEKVDIIKDINGKDRIARAEVKLSMVDTSYWHVEH